MTRSLSILLSLIWLSIALYNVNAQAAPGDTTPTQFTFADQTGVTLNTLITSDTFSATTLANSTGGFLLPPTSSGNPAFTSEHFSGSANCTMCHNGLSDQNGLDVSIETDWSSTMMANSTRDPFWRAKVRSELNRNPQLASVINDKCSRCHAPMANFEAQNAGEPLEILDTGFLNANHPRHDEALNGVSCTACHQIKNSSNLGTLSGFSGQYEIDSSKTIYGPYDNLFPNPMITNTGYTPTYSTHVKSSKLCATCHNLKTPYVDESGNVCEHYTGKRISRANALHGMGAQQLCQLQSEKLPAMPHVAR